MTVKCADVCVSTDNVISVSQMALVIKGVGRIIHYHVGTVQL